VVQAKHPSNNNVKAKIRQQLQFLRDKGVLDFVGRGQYRMKLKGR
jgi:type II restriction enzyme